LLNYNKLHIETINSGDRNAKENLPFIDDLMKDFRSVEKEWREEMKAARAKLKATPKIDIAHQMVSSRC
jgi:polyhydroxyalkanoate synthesis regulator phasin